MELLHESMPDANEIAEAAGLNLPTNQNNRLALMKLEATPKLLQLLNEGTPLMKEHAAVSFLELDDAGDRARHVPLGGVGPG